MHPKDFIKNIDESRLKAAIHQAESLTSGEIRVMISSKKTSNALEQAQAAFLKLGMTATKERNAVLIYLAPKSQAFAVIGDQGVHEKCGEHFWKEVAQVMETELRAGRITEALCEGVRRCGEVLARHFPHLDGDKNELSDEIARD